MMDNELGPIAEGEHKLKNPWCFWFTKKGTKGARQDTSWYQNVVKPIATVRTVEEFWRCYSHLIRPNQMVSPSDYDLFKKGIKPLWEDQANAKGGKWMVRLRKGLASEKWEGLILALIGETTGVGEEICGCVVSIRFQEDIIAVWVRGTDDEEKRLKIREAMRVALDLPEGTVLEYKEHNVSLKDNSSFRNTNVYRPPGARGGARHGGDNRGDSKYNNQKRNRYGKSRPYGGGQGGNGKSFEGDGQVDDKDKAQSRRFQQKNSGNSVSAAAPVKNAWGTVPGNEIVKEGNKNKTSNANSIGQGQSLLLKETPPLSGKDAETFGGLEDDSAPLDLWGMK